MKKFVWPGSGPPSLVVIVMIAIAVMLTPALEANANQSHGSSVAALTLSGTTSLPNIVATPLNATLANENCAIGSTTTATALTPALIDTSPSTVSAKVYNMSNSAMSATATAVLTGGGNCCGPGLTAGGFLYNEDLATAAPSTLTQKGRCCSGAELAET